MAEQEPRLQETRRLRANLQGEVDGAAIYQALARGAPDARLASVYQRLGRIEDEHAAFWRAALAARGDGSAPLRPTLRARLLIWIAGRFGAGVVAPLVAAGEARDSHRYSDQPDAKAAGFAADERGHARLMRAAGGQGGASGSAVAALEGRHRVGGGNVLRASVLGANDGLVSNLSLVMGVAGASTDGRIILMTGLAGLVAGACSMAMGEWLSVSSSRELAQNQLRAEAEELANDPEAEKEELALIYQARGFDEAAARALAEQIFQRPGAALDALAREELGIDPNGLGGSAWAAAGFSFLLFALGAVFPVVPYLFARGATAMLLSLAVSGLALAALGAGTALFTGRGLASSALRQLIIGYGAALVTFLVGKAVGVSLGG